MALWCICIACWIPKATNTHSGCVVLVVFPLQQWLEERVSSYVVPSLPVLLLLSSRFYPAYCNTWLRLCFRVHCYTCPVFKRIKKFTSLLKVHKLDVFITHARNNCYEFFGNLVLLYESRCNLKLASNLSVNLILIRVSRISKSACSSNCV